MSQKAKFAGMVLANQVLFLVMFAWKAEYGPTALPKLSPVAAGKPPPATGGPRPGLSGNSTASDPSAVVGDGTGKGSDYTGTQGEAGKGDTPEGGANSKDARGAGKTTSGKGRAAARGAEKGGKTGHAGQKAAQPPGGYLPMFHEGKRRVRRGTVQ